VQRCLFNRLTSSNPLAAALLSAMQAVMSERHQPGRQDGESLLHCREASPNPHAGVHIIVRLPEPLAMTNDGWSLTNWTPPRQPIQWNYPGSLLSSAAGIAITRIRLA
jgi:hypothetical protein